MMIFILILGVLLGTAGIVGYLAWLDYMDGTERVRRLVLEREHRLAEARIQRAMQDTVTQMFDTARRQQ